MAATSAMMTLSGSVAAAPANRRSSTAAFESLGVQHLYAVRPCTKVTKVVAAIDSANDEERS